MGNSDVSSIDRVFDLIDSFVDKTDRVLNRSKYTEEQHEARRAKGAKRPEVIDVQAVPSTTKAKAPKAAPSSSTAIATRRFRIVERITESGQPIFVVTNGSSSQAECSTRELAEKILRALEVTP